MDSRMEQISGRIRRWREEMGLTLQELASRSGVAASSIQKVETGQMVPSVTVLLKIARGLERRPSEIVSDDYDAQEVLYVQAKQHLMIGSARNIKVERLSGDLFDPSIEVWRLCVQPGYGSGRGDHVYDGEEVVIGEEGELVFQLCDETYRIRPGDTLQFKANIPHSWRNEGDVPARCLVVGTLPAGLRAKLNTQVTSGRRKRKASRP